jgi:hypothetical protein
MLYFPQLSSGATGQFPMQRQRVTRTVINQSADNYTVKLVDAAAAMTSWHISFAELTDQELAALEVLFEATEGRLNPFTFLDPTDNLLAWSEQQDQPAWQKDPLLTLAGSQPDPSGGAGAFRIVNTGGANQTIQQTINAPASLQYCFSVYARSDASTSLWLVAGSQTIAQGIGPQWSRLSYAAQPQGTQETINFGVMLAAGATVDVFGIQAEAQSAASLYKKTAEQGGVYPNARFRDDTLTITTAGPNRHSCELDIVNVEHL